MAQLGSWPPSPTFSSLWGTFRCKTFVPNSTLFIRSSPQVWCRGWCCLHRKSKNYTILWCMLTQVSSFALEWHDCCWSRLPLTSFSFTGLLCTRYRDRYDVWLSKVRSDLDLLHIKKHQAFINFLINRSNNAIKTLINVISYIIID